MDIIVTNAIAGSGKDTFVNKYLEQHPEAVHIRFKNPMYRIMAERYGLTFDEVLRLNEHENKDVPQDSLGGKTPREIVIGISEDEIKVARGETGVAQFIIDEILDTEEHGRKTFIFSDGGFKAEVDFIQLILKRYGLKRFTIVGIDNPNAKPLETKDSRSLFEEHDVILENNLVEDESTCGTHMYNQFTKFYYA